MTCFYSEKIWLDTDIGEDVDDIFALQLLLKHRARDIVGISTVNHNPGQKAQIARWLIEGSGNYRIPVYAGIGYNPSTHAPDMFHQFNPWWPSIFGSPRLDSTKKLYAGQGVAFSVFGISATQFSHNPEEAVDAIRRAIEEAAARQEKLTVISLGPLNNLAVVYSGNSFYARHSRIVSMGGWFHEPNEPLRIVRTGYNWGISPVATQVVLDSQVEMMVFPSSMTDTGNFWVNDLEYEMIQRAGNALERMNQEHQGNRGQREARALAIWQDWTRWNAAMFSVMNKKKLADPATVMLALFPDRIKQTVGVRVQYPIVNNQLTAEATQLDAFTSKNDRNLVQVTADPDSPVALITDIDDSDGFLRREILSVIFDLLLVRDLAS